MYPLFNEGDNKLYCVDKFSIIDGKYLALDKNCSKACEDARFLEKIRK